MYCGFLVLHVGINIGICYTMVVNLVLSFLVVDGSRRGSKGREERREVAHQVSFFSFLFGVSVLVIELSMLMHCRG